MNDLLSLLAMEWNPTSGSPLEHSFIYKTVWVICAFCNISNSHLANIPEEIDCDCLIAGDDVEAKQTASEIINKISGVKAVDCGILEKARIIEKITPLLIGLNIKYKSHYGGLRITGIPALDKE